MKIQYRLHATALHSCVESFRRRPRVPSRLRCCTRSRKLQKKRRVTQPRAAFAASSVIMVDRVQIHPLTLEFDDEILEAQLKSDTLNLTVMRAGCILTLMLLSCMESAGYGRLPVQFFGALFICLIAFVICYTPQFVIRFMPKRMQELISSKDKQHTSLTVLGVCVWSVCMLAWWRMIFTGALPRIQPHEFGKVLACCGLWVVATIGVHVLHFPFKCRVVFLFTSMPIVLTSEIAQPLLAALFGGTLLGHVLESVMRSNFRDRMHLVSG